MYAPFISFIIPFYNRFDLLKEALQSILDSAFKDVEIVLVDDASDAGGIDDLLEYTGRFKNITYIRQPENRGPGAARNRGLTTANGEWVFFMDSDDVIDGKILPELTCFLVKERGSDTVVFNNFTARLPDGRVQIKQFGDGTTAGIIRSLENGNVTLWHFCFKRDFLNKAGVLCPETYAFEDWAAFIYLYCNSKKCSFFPSSFYIYREDAEISLALHEKQFDFESERIPEGLNEFFSRLVLLLNMSINPRKKKIVRRFIHKFILNSLWKPEQYEHNEIVRHELNKLRNLIADYSENFSREIYISPCFMGAVNVAALIRGWGGRIAGFIDNNPLSLRAAACKKVSGLNIYTINETVRGGGG
jgi:glycosyltransferase involved in cell wall biosynthesis